MEEKIAAYLDQLTPSDIRKIAENFIEEAEMRDEVRFDEETNTFYWEVNGELLHD